MVASGAGSLMLAVKVGKKAHGVFYLWLILKAVPRKSVTRY